MNDPITERDPGQAETRGATSQASVTTAAQTPLTAQDVLNRQAITLITAAGDPARLQLLSELVSELDERQLRKLVSVQSGIAATCITLAAKLMGITHQDFLQRIALALVDQKDAAS